MTENKIIKTIGEMGPILPIGMVGPSGVLNREIKVRPWRLKEEREIGKAHAKLKNANLSQYVSSILAVMCKSLAGADFDSMSEIERKLMIGQMYSADVFYAYIWLRIQAIGPDLELDLPCPACENKFKFMADLTTIEVAVPEDPSKLDWVYEFRNPIAMRAREVPALNMGPLRWNTLETIPTGDISKAETQISVILGSVRGIQGEEVSSPLYSAELDEMGKFDYEMILKKIDEKNLGPRLVAEVECPNPQCSHKFLNQLDWNYNSFFAVSSA